MIVERLFLGEQIDFLYQMLTKIEFKRQIISITIIKLIVTKAREAHTIFKVLLMHEHSTNHVWLSKLYSKAPVDKPIFQNDFKKKNLHYQFTI